MTKSIDLRSRRGVAGPAGFILAIPAWYILVGILLVVAFWLWSLAINAGAIAQGTQAFGLGRNGGATTSDFQRAGLGGLASEYRGTTRFRFTDRAVVGEIDRTTDVTAFPVPPSFTVQVRTVARQEGFRARPPMPGQWE